MILNSQTMLSMYGIYYIKEDIFIPKKTKGFGLGADNEEQIHVLEDTIHI